MLFRFTNASIQRMGELTVVRNLDWSVEPGECWAITGPNGSGKTTLAEAIAGKHRISEGQFEHHFASEFAVQIVPFREESRAFSPDHFYYQQRYEFSEPDDCPTVREYLGTFDDTIVQQFHLQSLLEQPLIQLSNGQMRRTRIARVLLKRPQVLILDEPFAGLDAATQAELSVLLGLLVEMGQTLIVVTRGKPPAFVTKVIELQDSTPPTAPLPPGEKGVFNRVAATQISIEMHGVSIRHGDKYLLQSIDWTLRQGERWALTGPNGSGKTTLLSLIAGDHPQAFANDIRILGRRRGEGGDTIWDLKRKIGLVSPEMHLYFPRMLTGREATATGFFDTLTPQKMALEQAESLDGLIAHFDLTEHANKRWWQLSTGLQRAFLFIRAVIKRPPILLLDEPFQAMDARMQQKCSDWLTQQLSPEQTLVIVTHDESELPGCVEHKLQLSEGKLA